MSWFKHQLAANNSALLFTSLRLIPPLHVTSRHITSHHITSHHHIISHHHITSHHHTSSHSHVITSSHILFESRGVGGGRGGWSREEEWQGARYLIIENTELTVPYCKTHTQAVEQQRRQRNSGDGGDSGDSRDSGGVSLMALTYSVLALWYYGIY